MMRVFLPLVLLLLCSFASGEPVNRSLDYGAPSVEQGHDKLVTHTIFTVMYNLERHNPDWVAEYLTKEMVDSEAVQRKGFDFGDDPLIDGEATDGDYVKAGYDRGHMAPAEDMEMNATWMTECFMMTNMAPQKHALNGGMWKSMENLARKVAVRAGAAWIISGPIYRIPNHGECSGSIGKKTTITVPQAFFKVIVYRVGGILHALAFDIPHLQGPASAYGALGTYLTSIDGVEAETGLDFLSQLPVAEQAGIEAQIVSPSILETWMTK
jgi:endonuclease G